MKLNRQCQQVWDYLNEHGRITKREAMDLGIWNLPGRIHDLRGVFGADAILTEDVPNRSGRGTHGEYVFNMRAVQLDLLSA